MEDIARFEDLSYQTVWKVIQEHGDEWVAHHMKVEDKKRILELSQEGLNSNQIAERMHPRPKWNRWLVLWVLRRLPKAQLVNPIHDFIPEERKLKLRCQICGAEFELTKAELVTNPDRICNKHPDRRKGDRRSSIREI